MNTNPRESSSGDLNQSAPKRRRVWPWILVCCIAPCLILGAVAYSFLVLDRDVALLRKQVMAATHADWKTKVQMSVGQLTLCLVRTGLSFVDNKEMADAKLALRAVRCISVGVYERQMKSAGSWAKHQLLVDTDKAMRRRGWSRLVGVVDKNDTVLIYGPANYAEDEAIDICLSVVNDRELVVVSATLSPAGLAELVEKHLGDDLSRSLKRVLLQISRHRPSRVALGVDLRRRSCHR